jgi:pimeloyl-ACP methyl ester carboxylesterase
MRLTRGSFYQPALSLAICAAVAAAELPTERVVLQSFDGRSAPAEMGRITAPASRRNPGRQVSVAFYRLPAKNPGKSIPIVFLMGGPGVPATFIAKVPPYFDLFDALSGLSPVILLDQRGTGQSTPKVDCPAGFQPPPNLFLTPQALEKAYAGAYAACANYWSARQAFPDDYSVDEIADDIEDLRAGLNVPQVDLLALSFGTRIAIEMIRRHPASVHRAVLQGTVTPDGLVRLPSEMDAFFQRTAAEARPQAAAKGLDEDLAAAYRSVLQKLRSEPLPVPITASDGRKVTVEIGSAMFAALVATRTTDPRLPALLTSVNRRDASVIALILQSVYRDLESGAGNMMAHSAPCSGTDPANRPRLARQEASRSLLAEPFDNSVVTGEFCREIGSTKRIRNQPVVSGAMPVLFITGDLDDRTPVSLAKSAAKGFPQAQSIVVRNGGHELLVEPPVREQVLGFLRNGEIAKAEIVLTGPIFPSMAEAAQPPARPR